jgi:hypothetical protein
MLSTERLLHLLATTSPQNPKFTLLLGSGASASSGIKTGWQLIQEWRAAYDESCQSDQDKAFNQTWYNKPTEYGRLFEEVFRTQAMRREFIETCIANASPSWGYLYGF